ARPPMLVPWEPLDAIEAVGVLYFGMAVMGVGVGMLLGQTVLHDAPPVVRVIVTGIQYLLFSGATLAVLWRRIQAPVQRRWRILGLRTGEMARLIASGIGGYGVLVVALVVATYTFSGGRILGFASFGQAGERLVSSATGPGARVLLFVLICIIAPVIEEIIFRGFVYPGLRRRMTVTSAVVASALLFALMHNNLDALFTIGIIGVTLAVLYERTRSLVPCIVCHALNNTLVFFLLLLTQ
ncbi:MAG: CPBP family intramembrane glutamic endopeptidase, partial [Armatimonadia bacterium]